MSKEADVSVMEASETELNEEISDIKNTADFPWVLFTINNIIYGIHSSHVLSIEILGGITPIVNSAAHSRGVTNFRGDMIPLTDLRILFGLQDRFSEFHELITPKIDAHRVWVETLESCVRERKPFTLATDPHNCAFGKWYYSFKTDSSVLSLYLKRIEAPHSTLHKTGGKITELIKNENYEEAESLLHEVIEPVYAETIALLNGAEEAYRDGTREMLVVIEAAGVTKGIIVDAIESVEYLNNMIPIDESDDRKYVKILAKRERDNATILIIDEDIMDIF